MTLTLTNSVGIGVVMTNVDRLKEMLRRAKGIWGMRSVDDAMWCESVINYIEDREANRNLALFWMDKQDLLNSFNSLALKYRIFEPIPTLARLYKFSAKMLLRS